MEERQAYAGRLPRRARGCGRHSVSERSGSGAAKWCRSTQELRDFDSRRRPDAALGDHSGADANDFHVRELAVSSPNADPE